MSKYHIENSIGKRFLSSGNFDAFLLDVFYVFSNFESIVSSD